MRLRKDDSALLLWLLSAALLLLIVSVGVFSERYFAERAARRGGEHLIDSLTVGGGPYEFSGPYPPGDADRITFRATTTVGDMMRSGTVTYALVPGGVAPAPR